MPLHLLISVFLINDDGRCCGRHFLSQTTHREMTGSFINSWLAGQGRKAIAFKQMKVSLWHHRSPPFLLSFLVSRHIMNRKATYTEKHCS